MPTIYLSVQRDPFSRFWVVTLEGNEDTSPLLWGRLTDRELERVTLWANLLGIEVRRAD